ncbi:spore germination protein [Bacillus sp. JJ722]|uniref:spore germination protein n=1 Tax=Bacillus sp. JJ722 TaxID=3122973 RepID=UPI002FFEA4E4
MSSLETLKSQFEFELGNTSDLVSRPFTLQLTETKINGLLFYLDGIVDEGKIEESIIHCLQGKHTLNDNPELLNTLASETLQIKNLKILPLTPFDKVLDDLLAGNTIIVFDGQKEVISAATTKLKERAISAPESQRVLRGPHIGFNENLNSNIALIRGIIKNKYLTFEQHKVGSKTNTNICLVYLRDQVDPTTLNELQCRLENIQIREVFDSNYIEEYIHDDFVTPFPLILNTDRPDVITAEILNSKIAILVDGTAYGLVLPAPLISFIQSPDDYYLKWNFLFNRLLRFCSMILGIYIPGLYIAFVNFEPGFVPYDLIISLAAQSENKPLPLVIEVLLFTVLLTIIIESALRLNKNLVLTVSLFGALIIGQASFEAGIVQPATLIVVSVSYILGFAVPIQTMETSIRLMRYLLILMSATLGLYGLTLTTIIFIVHLSHLRSFGVPYLSPIAPFNLKDQKDTLIRSALPKILNTKKELPHEKPFFKKKK